MYKKGRGRTCNWEEQITQKQCGLQHAVAYSCLSSLREWDRDRKQEGFNLLTGVPSSPFPPPPPVLLQFCRLPASTRGTLAPSQRSSPRSGTLQLVWCVCSVQLEEESITDWLDMQTRSLARSWVCVCVCVCVFVKRCGLCVLHDAVCWCCCPWQQKPLPQCSLAYCLKNPCLSLTKTFWPFVVSFIKRHLLKCNLRFFFLHLTI